MPAPTWKSWFHSRLAEFSGWQYRFGVVDVSAYASALKEKRILIVGGTGSLGHCLASLYSKTNSVSIISRDENKQWTMKAQYPNIDFYLGDIRDRERMEELIRRARPHIIIIAAALKHIDRCEFDVEEALATNYRGVRNVICAVRGHPNVECVLLISTDKACLPMNTYGLSKALAERSIVEAAAKTREEGGPRFVGVRYGNVLRSRGSILEILQRQSEDESVESYTLTHSDMTRFIMTQTEAVRLINFAIAKADTGEIVVPHLNAMKMRDVFDLFSSRTGKSVRVVGIRPGEKVHESLLSEFESMHAHALASYTVIEPPFANTLTTVPGMHDSSTCTLDKEVLDLLLS
ncbi:hypothetical protein HDU93_000918 [Gonapodya sp. JEL0774]|nr:hypothetical protein HDU93_000918 [Gonapodya sp. JEL0774]